MDISLSVIADDAESALAVRITPMMMATLPS
jgi:hypothetical protein